MAGEYFVNWLRVKNKDWMFAKDSFHGHWKVGNHRYSYHRPGPGARLLGNVSCHMTGRQCICLLPVETNLMQLLMSTGVVIRMHLASEETPQEKLLTIVNDTFFHLKGEGKSESVESANGEPDPLTLRRCCIGVH